MYDLLILGGGPAGYRAAERAGAAGLTTVLVEKDQLGGICLNEGCIPSKTLLYCSKRYMHARSSQAFGVSVGSAMFDLAAVMTRKEKIIETLRNGIAFSLKKQNVVIESGNGVILPRTGTDFGVEVDGRIVEASRLLICTGSEPIHLPLPGIEQEFVYTNREALSINRIPEKIVIIGGGAIGLEFATFFIEAGSTVTVIELLPFIGGGIDPEISQALKRELEKKGIRFRLGSRVTAIGDHAVTVVQDDRSESVDADVVLMSVGRRPAISTMGLEHLGVTLANGAIQTDKQGRTNIAGIWAAGDVNGKAMLAHTAYREAEACVNDMRGINDRVNYDAIPSVIYSHPEVASVGMTAEQAEGRGIDVTTAKLPLTYNGKYLAENDGSRGLCKVVLDKKDKRLLGVHLMGNGVAELISAAATMVEKGMPAQDIAPIVFPHPTASEIIADTIQSVSR